MYIGITVLTLGIPMFLFSSPKPFWKGIVFCLLICFVCFGYIWLSKKIRRKFLSPEERATEDEEKQKQEKMLEASRYKSYLSDSWITKHINEPFSNRINDAIYKRMDEMIEQAEDPETKIMLLKKKNEMLQDDISKLK